MVYFTLNYVPNIFKLRAIFGNQQVLIIATSKLENADNTTHWLRDIASLALLIGIFYALWIGSHALIVPDEGRYSEVAREMVVSGDYITPRLNGVAFLDKPVLYYWLQASAIKLFGIKEWALRFWPALIGVLGTLVLYGTGRLLFDRRTGFIAAIMLATSPLYYGAAHYANLDLEVASLVADSLLCFLAAMQGDASRKIKNYLLLAAYFFAGLAALTKGLIGIVFPAMIIGSWILLLGRWQTLTKMRLFSGFAIFLIITLPWYVLVQRANPEFLHFFFVTQQVSRFLTTQEFNSKAPLWFYVPVVLAGFFPWSVFLVQAISQKIRHIWQNRQRHATNLFLLLWLFSVFTFFSIPHSKTVGYILPIFPVLSLIVGSYVSQAWDEPKRAGIVIGLIVFMIASVAIAMLFLAAPHMQIFDVPAAYFVELRNMGGVLLLAVLASYLVFTRTANLKRVFVGLTATIALLLLVFIFSVNIINEKSSKPIAVTIKSLIKPGDEVVAYYKYYQDLPLYLEQRVTIVADWHAPDIAFNDNWLREMWYGMVFQDTSKWLIEENSFWQRWRSDKRLFVVTNEDHYQSLKTKTQVYKISQFNDLVLLSNQA
jgi:4-amino-4-deoxy-L-arabinose transferase-like glycosyltransferase